MEAFHQCGIEFVLRLQAFSPALDKPFLFFTMMGDEIFYLLLLPLLYWTLDRSMGVRLTIVFLLSAYINILAKQLFDQPRPFDIEPAVKMLVGAEGGGFPSGHTQNAVVVWGYLAARYHRGFMTLLAALLMVLIPLSRVYLGVHFPIDLAGGYVIGAAILLFYLKSEGILASKGDAAPFPAKICLATAVPLVFLLLLPVREEMGVTVTATMLGMGTGFVLERRLVMFGTGGSPGKRLTRFLLGLVVLFVLRIGLKSAFSELEPELLLRFIRYGLIGFWGGFGAPLLFALTKLAPSARYESSEPGD